MTFWSTNQSSAAVPVNKLSGHGHVTPNADGSRAPCGGPAICAECALAFARAHGVKPTHIKTPKDARGACRTLELGSSNWHENDQLLREDRAAAQARVDEFDRLIAINDEYRSDDDR